MSGPKRIQLSRAKGWRMPPGAVKVDRSTRWGNPFIVGAHMTADEAVHRYRMIVTSPGAYYDGAYQPDRAEQMLAMARVQTGLQALRGHDLACWCKPDAPCHADVLLELANAEPSNG